MNVLHNIVAFLLSDDYRSMNEYFNLIVLFANEPAAVLQSLNA